MKKLNKAFIIIILIYFFQGLIHNLGHPVTPAFVTDDLEIPKVMFGVFFATMSFGLVVGAPIWGVIADKGYKRIAMVAGLLLYSIGQFAFGYVGNMYWMVFFRFVSGFGVSASVTLFISHTVEISKPENRAKHLAWMAAALALGKSLGYWIGGFISTNTWFIDSFNTGEGSFKNIFLIQALINIIHAGVVFIVIKETNHKPKTKQRSNFIQSFKDLGKIDKNVLLFLVSLIFMSIAFTNFSKYLDVYFNDLGYTTDVIGNFNLVIGLVGIATSIFIVPLIIKFNKNLLVFQIIQITSILAVLYVFRSSNFIVSVYSVFMIFIVGQAIYRPLEQHFISEQVKDGLYSTTMGIRQSFFSIGMVIGPLIAGVLIDIKPIYAFDFNTLMLGIAFILVFIVNLRMNHNKKQSAE